MDEELLINVSGFETRVALLHNHALAEVHLERSGPYSLTGNIYRGRVVRVYFRDDPLTYLARVENGCQLIGAADQSERMLDASRDDVRVRIRRKPG